MIDESRAGRLGRVSNLVRKRLALAALLVLVALAGFIFIRNLIDFPVYYAAGQSLLAGRTDLYAPDFARGPLMDYRYPPFFLLAFTPLWLLPYRIAAYVWYLLGVAEIGGCLAAVSRSSRKVAKTQSPQSGRGRVAIGGLALLGVAQYLLMNLHYGNAQMLTTFLVVAGLYLAMGHPVATAPGTAGVEGKGREAWAALLMALAITIKVTPALLLPYFAMKKRWRLLVLTGAFGVALNLAPALYFGPAGNARLLGEWYRHIVADQQFHEINGPVNLSLKGQLHRSLTQIDYGKRLDGDSNYPAVNLLRVSPDEVDRIWIILAACLFAATLILIWRAGTPQRAERSVEQQGVSRGLSLDQRRFLEIGVMICLMLLIEPLTSKIYFVALIWPMWALLEFGYGKGERTTRARAIATAAGALAMVNVALPLLPGRSIQRLVLVLGSDFYLACSILVLGLYALVLNRSEVPSRAGEPQTRYPQAAKTP
jgi:hypothetical protein